MATTDYSPNSMGRVVQVIGPVVDVAFDSAELPEINTALLLTNKAIDNRDDNLTVEVLSLGALVALLLSVRRLGMPRRAFVRLAATVVFIIGSCLTLSAGNATEHSEVPALIVIPAIFYAAIRRDTVVADRSANPEQDFKERTAR